MCIMADMITTVTSIVTAAAGWAASFGTMIVETPILMLFVAVPLVGLGVGLFRRLININ